MPLYLYACPECDIEIEERRAMNEADAQLVCPMCGEACQRVVAVSFARAGMAHEVSQTGPSEFRRALRHGTGCDCCTPRRR